MELPAELFLLKNVTRLDLYKNSLATLPAELGALVNLERLNVQQISLATRSSLLTCGGFIRSARTSSLRSHPKLAG